MTIEKKITAFSGAHGTGKTTAVYGKAHYLKKVFSGFSVGIIGEAARMCPLPIISQGNNRSCEAAQMWIFSHMIQADIDAALSFDMVVADRTVCDAIAYTIISGHSALADAMINMARHHVGIYKNVYLMDPERYDYQMSDGVRSTDKGLRKEVHEALLSIYKEIDLRFTWYEDEEDD